MLLLGLAETENLPREMHRAGVSLRETMLARYAGIRKAVTESAPGGKPFLPDYPAVDFSVSHSEGLVVCALRFPGDTLPAEAELMPPEGLLLLPPRIDPLQPAFFRLPEETAGRAVGTDTERLREMPEGTVHRIARRYFPEETPPAEEDSAWLLRRWTRLESRCKCSGRGLAGALEPSPAGVCRTWEAHVSGEIYALSVFSGT